MNSKWFCKPATSIKHLMLAAILAGGCYPGLMKTAVAGAPGWMHALKDVPLPEHDEKTDAVLLCSEHRVTVHSESKVTVAVRQAYRILRSGGREYAYVGVPFHPALKITGMRGWCVPAQGKDYEVKEKNALESSIPNILGSELITDVKIRILQIPAADPGAIVGYEYETEEQPNALQALWYFQDRIPVREAHFTLELPKGWEYKAVFINAADVKPRHSGDEWQWSVSDIKALKPEEMMPPPKNIMSHMILSFYPAGGPASVKSFSDWRQMGIWYSELTRGRSEASLGIKQKVDALAPDSAPPLEKARKIAQFVQKEIRYVAIELGIGGLQPHPAQEVFTHLYGDCKDKVTLMMTMLREAGLDSYYVLINSTRGSATREMQPHAGLFNHAIAAIRLPSGVDDASLVATLQHPELGILLFFDPSDEFVPFGQIGGPLQDNNGLLVTPQGGDLIKLPRQPAKMNSLTRTARLTLSTQGTLTGDFEEIRVGDHASKERAALRSAATYADRIKHIEILLSQSLPTFRITKATVVHFNELSEPFQYRYSITAPGYAKTAGNLLLVRPRVVGIKSGAFPEIREPRQSPVEFESPSWESDTFEIELPRGYEVDALPPPVDVDCGFASYSSKTEASGNIIRYSRIIEIKELNVPVGGINELQKFYRAVAADERNTAVLKPSLSR